ncbi:MAG TPA: TIGR03435 family protein [Bryobacteraceae bacterium]|nr:TIGR03435 family protein [Bryobacteraceae bacterium]
MLRAIMGAGLVVFASCLACAQPAQAPLSFEVASVKPAAPQELGRMMMGFRGGPGTPDPERLTCTNVTLKMLIQNAWDVRSFQISGPASLESEHYDITAKIPKGATKEQFQLMLQDFLAERFKLTLHHESKELPLYALVVAKNGPKMKESEEDPPPDPNAPKDANGPSAGGGLAPLPPPGRLPLGKDGMPQFPPGAGRGGMIMMVNNGRFRMAGNKQPMARLADMLSQQLGRPVVDMTGLTKKYDYTLDYTPDPSQRMGGPMGGMIMAPPPHPGEGGGAPAAPPPDPEAGPSLFTALQEQLGLKLDQRKGPVDLLVIDGVEKTPTEN